MRKIGLCQHTVNGYHNADWNLYACAVTLQDKQLRPKKAPQHHAWRFESGAYIEITWDQYKAGLGNTVTIQTGG